MQHGKVKPQVKITNKANMAYAEHLESRKLLGEITDWWSESVTLVLAPKLECRYTPDFMVLTADGYLELHEVKGFWRDDAKVKVKVAASMFPFKFFIVTVAKKKDGGGWKMEELKA